jgi:hypothetical protein
MQNNIEAQTDSIMKIQGLAFQLFYNRLGPTWKKTIKRDAKLVYKLDYYCYLHGINDPWYDYSDDPKYAYDSDNN